MTTNHKYALDILQEAVTTWQHHLADPELRRVDRALGEAVLPDVQGAIAALKAEHPVTDRLDRIENLLGEIGHRLGVEREPCEDPTPAEQADYDRAEAAMDKDWHLLDHACAEGTWAVHSFQRQKDGDRTEITRTFTTREGAAHHFRLKEKDLRDRLSGTVAISGWRAETFTVSMYGPGNQQPVLHVVGLTAGDPERWLITSWKDGIELSAREGWTGTPAKEHPDL